MKKVVSTILIAVMLLISLNITAFAAGELNITPASTTGFIKIDTVTAGLTDTRLETEIEGKNSSMSVGWGISSGRTHRILAAETDRGTSIEVSSAPTAGGDTQIADPQLHFTLNNNKKYASSVYVKSSVYYPDTNFSSSVFQIRVRKKNNASYEMYSIFSISPTGTVKTFNGTVNTGITFTKNSWYDIEAIYDTDSGYLAIHIKNGNQKYYGKGFVANRVDDAGIDRIFYKNSSSASSKTSLYVDDVQWGEVTKIAAPVSKSYDFAGTDVPTTFKTTGGTAAISGGALSITGSENADTVTAMALPFDNTKFVYTADVIASDFTADRSLMAGSVELAKLGADKKLYIGGTAVDGVTLAAGTYPVKVIVDQPNYTATVNIANATQNVSLGSSAVNLVSVDWKVAAAANTVTVLDNVSVKTLYGFGADALTTVSGTTIPVASDVEVKFTNPIDISSFNASSVKVDDAAFTGNITKADDWTVKLSFEKEPNGTYKIDFINAKDIIGSTATVSYTVNTERQDLVMSDVSFSRNGQPLDVATAGTVTANFDAKAYNGTSYEALYMLGLYKGGHLTDCVYDTVSIGGTKQSYPLSITIPNDGYYILKAFVWDKATLKPFKDVAILKALKDDDKVALVKFDDLDTNNINRFMTIAEWAEDNDIDMNFIFMVDYFDPEREDRVLCNESHLEKLKKLYDSPYIELTSHSYTLGSDNSFYGTATLEQQMEDFDKVKEVMAKQGITITSMAPPNSQVNSDTRTALNAHPEYKAMIVKHSSNSTLNSHGFFNKNNNFVTLWKSMDVEVGGTGTTDTLENLKTKWNEAMNKGYEYVVLQAHPRTWTTGGASEQNTYNFLLWLKAQGVKFMKATEYAEYLMSL